METIVKLPPVFGNFRKAADGPHCSLDIFEIYIAFFVCACKIWSVVHLRLVGKCHLK